MMIVQYQHYLVFIIFLLCSACRSSPHDVLRRDDLCQHCSCVLSTVNCSHLNLESFPIHPMEDWGWVIELDLRGNLLSEVPQLDPMSNLKKLCLMNNQIAELKDSSFKGLRNLTDLNLDGNLISFAEQSISEDMLRELTSITTIRLKQSIKPDSTADFCFLSAVSTTLKHLYMTGIPQLPSCFSNLTSLQTLSLGGQHCNITEMDDRRYGSLKTLPLDRLSIRNCGVSSISPSFLQHLDSLRKLDLSCNPLSPYIEEILSGIRSKSVKTLLIDFINHNQTSCTWNQTKELFGESLEIFSAQANQIEIFNLTVPMLRYLNYGQNTLGGAAFYYNKPHWTNCHSNVGWFWCQIHEKLNRIQYLGIDAITQPLECGTYDKNLLDCNAESVLFENDQFEWDHVDFPDYVPWTLFETLYNQFAARPSDLERVIEDYILNGTVNHTELPQNSILGILRDVVENDNKRPADFWGNLFLAWMEGLPEVAKYLLSDKIKKISTEAVIRWKNLDGVLKKYVTNTAINWSLNEFSQPDTERKLLEWFRKRMKSNNFPILINFYPVNLTTVSATYNRLPFLAMPQGNPNSRSLTTTECNDVDIQNNNLRRLDFTHSSAVSAYYVPCGNVTGFDKLTSIQCEDCSIQDVNTSFLNSLSNLTNLELADNWLGERLRASGKIFNGSANLVNIQLAGQKDGIRWFEHQSILTDIPKLKVLGLQRNQIEIWNLSLSANLQIELLNLSENSLTFIDAASRNDFERAHKSSDLVVDLRGNPVGCECISGREELIEWLIEKNSYMIVNLDKIHCKDGTTPIQANKCKNPSTSPNGNMTLLVTLTVCGTFGIVAFMCLFLYRRAHRNGYTRLSENSENQLVLYVSCPIEMFDEVSRLKVKLSEMNLEVLMPDLGRFGAPNTETIPNCSKFIFFLDDSYFSDERTIQEFRLIERAGMLNDGKAIFVLRSLSINSLPTTIQSLVNNGNFIVWPDCTCGNVGALENFAREIVTMSLQ